MAARTRRIWLFTRAVLKAFSANRGLLLAGGVGYNALLSLIPLLTILLLALAKVWERDELVAILNHELPRIVPGYAEPITAAVTSFIDSRHYIGVVSIGVLLFFSSLAFRMLEGAFGVIFAAVPTDRARRAWVSLIIPYVYMLVLGLVVLALAIGDSILTEGFTVMGDSYVLDPVFAVLAKTAGFFVMALLFASLYLVLPEPNISVKRALIGGVVVSVLWEVVRRLLVWYFANLSLVNVIYGSLATVVVVLVTMEVVAIIVLLGAQVIAELEKEGADVAGGTAP